MSKHDVSSRYFIEIESLSVDVEGKGGGGGIHRIHLSSTEFFQIRKKITPHDFRGDREEEDIFVRRDLINPDDFAVFGKDSS